MEIEIILIDSYGRNIGYLRVSVTDRCDLRCAYCIPKGFKGFEEPKNWLTLDEIYRVIACFSRLGTKHFRFRGGEPLLRKPGQPGQAGVPGHADGL